MNKFVDKLGNELGNPSSKKAKRELELNAKRMRRKKKGNP